MDYHQKSVEEILNQFNAGTSGLTAEEAGKRLEAHGYNELQTCTEFNLLLIFLNQFKSFIIYILLFAIAFSLLIGEYVDAVIILLILLVNATIGFCQELSAHKSLDSLKKISTLRATVLRSGRPKVVNARELVPGDIIQLEAGDKVPADARILESVRLKVDESALTGESVPVEKHPRPIVGQVPLGDRANMLYSATGIAAGNSRALVVATGMATELGKITELIKQAEEVRTPLQQRLDRFGKQLSYLIICICLLVFGLFFSKALLADNLTPETFFGMAFVAISLAVAAVPTALPAVVTIALSIGVKRLLHKQALVRNLSSVETLGSCDVICTDKTGTLTSNQMTVRRAWTADGELQLGGSGYKTEGEVSGPLVPELFVCGLLCNNASRYEENGAWQVTGDPTEVALLVSANKAGVTSSGRRLNEIPFDAERKLMSVLIDAGDSEVIYCKGAPDQLLACCDRILVAGDERPLNEECKQQIEQVNRDYAAQAMRVLGFARKRQSAGMGLGERQLCFLGLQAMLDPPRPDVPDAIAKTKQAGIRVIMITGDYGATAEAIGREIGIEGELLSGSELETMDDEQLRRALQQGTNIFSRVSPTHKQRIIDQLQQLGKTVAMTGDGVNDAPALKKANIGVAVGSGTEVARDAADFVLLDDSFSHIVNAIEEGRGIYANIQKSIMLLLSGNLGEVLIIFLAALIGMNLPLTAILLLWINMVTDGAPALAYSVDPHGKEIMQQPPKPAAEGILPAPKLALLAVLGCCGSLLALGIFSLYHGFSPATEHLVRAQTMVFNFVVLYELILTFVIRGSYRVPFFTNRWVWLAAGLSIVLQAILLYTPLAEIFKITPLTAHDLLILLVAGSLFAALSLGYLLLAKACHFQ